MAESKRAERTDRATRRGGPPRAAARRRAAPAAKRSGNVITPATWGPAARTEALAAQLGGVTALARILGVSPSQPSRWRSGKEQPSTEVARRLLDLDHVVARASLVWNPEVVPTWLESANAHLDGQTPLGVLMTRGPAEVLVALDATEAGGFA